MSVTNSTILGDNTLTFSAMGVGVYLLANPSAMLPDLQNAAPNTRPDVIDDALIQLSRAGYASIAPNLLSGAGGDV